MEPPFDIHGGNSTGTAPQRTTAGTAATAMADRLDGARIQRMRCNAHRIRRIRMNVSIASHVYVCVARQWPNLSVGHAGADFFIPRVSSECCCVLYHDFNYFTYCNV